MRASSLGIKPEKPQPKPAPVKPEATSKAEPKRERAGQITPIPATFKPANLQPANAQTWGGFGFMRIPAGKFLMGSQKDNKRANDDEQPQHAVDIPYDYWMTHFLVTVAEYSEGYKNKGMQKQRDHPAVGVSWKDAMEYCQWRDRLTKGKLPEGYCLRLPTEAEWEKAARGADGREWPWGNEFDKNKCNSLEGGIGGTTPVGLYSPQGDSPYGCADMAGNVWEWTHSLYKPYPYRADDGREDGTASGSRVLRGGSFKASGRSVRAVYRGGNIIDSVLMGFRVVVAPIIPL